MRHSRSDEAPNTRFWEITDEEIHQKTVKNEKFLLFENAASWATVFTQLLLKYSLNRESKDIDVPSNSEEVYEYYKRMYEDEQEKLKVGYVFGFPERITSFWDSMRVAFFLNSHGHYTQSLVMLRLALDTILVSSIKWILQSDPKRLDESKRIQKMFKHLEISRKETKSGILDRINKIGSHDHEIYLNQAIRELVDYGIIEDHKYWFRYLKIHKLNAHVHSKDEFTDRFNTSSIGGRKFSIDFMQEFVEIAFAIIDLQLCLVFKLNNKSLRKNWFLAKPPSQKEKFKLHYVDMQSFLPYIPNFAKLLNPGWVSKCIECKTKPLNDKNYICGECKKSMSKK